MSGAGAWLEPELLLHLGDLRLAARTVVDGYLAGQQVSPRIGAGHEFQQYRAYQPGDDLRRLDWRMYARSDRYFVRESTSERDITVRFVLDTSASMAHRSHDGAPAKLDVAKLLTGALAYVADRQGDRVVVVTTGGAVSAGGSATRDPYSALLVGLDTVTAGGGWPPFEELQGRLGPIRQRQLVVVVSDLHDHDGRIDRSLSRLALGHEVVVFHLLARDELELTTPGVDAGSVEFEDLETGASVRLDPDRARPAYRERLGAHLEQLRNRLLDLSIAYQLVVTDEPLGPALRTYLLRRERLP